MPGSSYGVFTLCYNNYIINYIILFYGEKEIGGALRLVSLAQGKREK